MEFGARLASRRGPMTGAIALMSPSLAPASPLQPLKDRDHEANNEAYCQADVRCRRTQSRGGQYRGRPKTPFESGNPDITEQGQDAPVRTEQATPERIGRGAISSP